MEKRDGGKIPSMLCQSKIKPENQDEMPHDSSAETENAELVHSKWCLFVQVYASAATGLARFPNPVLEVGWGSSVSIPW